MKSDNTGKSDIKIGTILKNTRKSLGLTQEKVAEHLDLAARYISDIERNKVKGSLDTLIGLCNLYNVTPTYILRDYISNVDEKITPSELIGFFQLSSHDKQIIVDLIQIMNSKEGK